MSNGIIIKSGLRQGDPLSSILFNVAMEKVIRESRIEHKGIQLGNTNFGVLAYADDAVLIEEDKRNLSGIAKKVIVTARIMGLEINEEKTDMGFMDSVGSHYTERTHTNRSK